MEALADARHEAHLDRDWLRAQVGELAAIERETASTGEREAAEWVAARLADVGAEARLEEEASNGGYWWPLGLAAGAGLVAGIAALRGRRALAATLGATACAAGIDDLPPRSRRLRSVLPKRRAWNVVAALGPAEAKRTVVLIAHHDTAHSGLVFHPALPLIADRLGLLERADASPPLMWPVVAGPGVVAAGALTRSRALVGLGTALSAGSAAAMADIGSRGSVPGANDNASGVVAMLAVAQALAERPTESLRVMLVSTSEEATCEGMHHFAARHFPHLPREGTFLASIDTVGSPHLTVLRGEGMFGLKRYPAEALALADGLAEELGIWLFPNLSLRNATDGVYPLNAGYQCVSICSVNDLKNPANYHWPTDVPENVDYDTLADAIRLTEAVVRRLDERWL
ncbi:MAG: M28 family peptidase [Solirubrobacterales bacterium]